MAQSSATCPKCDVTFSSKDVLKQHIAVVHEGKKAYKCPTCQKTFFTSRSGLMINTETVHEEKKPNKCPKCEKTFPQISGLTIQGHRCQNAKF